MVRRVYDGERIQPESSTMFAIVEYRLKQSRTLANDAFIRLLLVDRSDGSMARLSDVICGLNVFAS